MSYESCPNTNGSGSIDMRRTVGKLTNLEDALSEKPLAGHIGIGHTRWATHGPPSEENAHPHRAGKVVVIHNGIIENFLELKKTLEERGRTFHSETDTEVISQLIDHHMDEGMEFMEAARAAVRVSAREAAPRLRCHVPHAARLAGSSPSAPTRISLRFRLD